MILFISCRFNNNKVEEDKAISINKVAIISNGKEYAPIQNWIFEQTDELAADGLRKYPADVSNELPNINIADDFDIIIDGTTYGGQSYTLYNVNFQEVYSKSKFEMPIEDGEYILCIELTWGSSERFSGYQYFFKINK